MDVAFGKLDSNGDGYIDLDELIVRLPMLTGTDNPEAERVLAVRPTPLVRLGARVQGRAHLLVWGGLSLKWQTWASLRGPA